MELSDLQKFVVVLVLTGMVLGVGILIIDQFGLATRDITIVTNESHNITVINGSTTLTYTPVISCSAVRNASGTTMSTSDYTCISNGSVTTTLENGTNNPYYWDYKYYQNTTTSNTMLTGVTPAISPIATTWLGLIVTVVVLAIILTLVIRSFVIKRK